MRTIRFLHMRLAAPAAPFVSAALICDGLVIATIKPGQSLDVVADGKCVVYDTEADKLNGG